MTADEKLPSAASHAIVIGASVAGLASACALAMRGWRVTVLERRPDLLEGGRAFLLQPNGLTALESLGALAAVRERALVVSGVSFYLAGRGPVAVYDYGELRHQHAYALEIRPQALRLALAERADRLGVPSPRFGCAAVEVVHQAETVIAVRCRHADGSESEHAADLVVAADGPGSRMRGELGIGCRQLSHPDRYVLGTVDVTRPTAQVQVYCGRGFANGVAPLPDGTYFWDCVTDANRQAVEARDLEAWRATYKRRVPCAPEFAHAIEGWEELTPIEAQTFWAKACAVEGAVLVGDAAGALHPHSAQGANLALEDATSLGEALDRNTWPGRVPAGSLASWARARHRKRRRYVLWSLLAAGSLDAPTPGWRLVRRSGFLWSHVGPMRRELLRRQAGLAAGDSTSRLRARGVDASRTPTAPK